MNQPMQVSEEDVLAALQTVYDPELGLDIVNLGLIYAVLIQDHTVHIVMTLTTPGCPLHDSIRVGAEQVLARLPGVEQITVELTWNPPWQPGRMSRAARAALGFPF